MIGRLIRWALVIGLLIRCVEDAFRVVLVSRHEPITNDELLEHMSKMACKQNGGSSS